MFTFCTSRSSSVAVLVAAAVMVLCAAPASAQFDGDQLNCRKTISKQTAKLAKTVGKVVAGCHKARLKEKIDAANDCNDLDGLETDPKNKVAKSEGKLSDKTTSAKGKCLGLSPNLMGYNQCPAPCDVVVPTVASMTDLVDCLICVVETEVTAMTTASLDAPTPPLAKDDQKCHGTIAKEQAKHLGVILKERSKCQNFEESKNGEDDPAACAGLDPNGKITATQTKGELKIAGKCGPADLTQVASCATTNTVDLNACVYGDSASRGETLFGTMYELGNPTWAGVQNLFIASGCASGLCHGSSPGQGNLGNLGDFDLGHEELVVEAVDCLGSAFTSRVVPFDDANSFLIAKLEGTHDCGDMMPLSGLPLTPAQIELVREWILDGAQKN